MDFGLVEKIPFNNHAVEEHTNLTGSLFENKRLNICFLSLLSKRVNRLYRT